MMNIQLEQLSDDKSYHGHEENITNFWKKLDINKKLNENNNSHDTFRFMDGPIFVSSDKGLHYGHLYISSLKNTILQYQYMQKKLCLNKIGYDCHGLPIEMNINKKLGTYTKKDVEEFGIDKYNEACKEFIYSCSGSWTPIFERIGRIVDFNNNYKTMDTNYMESEWFIFKQLWEKGLIYKNFRVMPYSTGCETSLSNFEANENQKEENVKSIYVCFKVKNEKDCYLVAWTTTPWTLFSNLALCVNPNTEYVKVHDTNEKKYIVSIHCVNNLKVNVSNVESLGLGNNLNGLVYEPLFNYMNRDKYQVIIDGFVNGNCTIGTGIVHVAPSHGKEDFEACIKNNIIDAKDLGKYCPIDDQGKYTNQITDFEGKYVFHSNDDIIKLLKQKGLHLRTESYKHKYAYCYRTDTPLINKPMSGYFIKTSGLKDDMLKNNDKVNWYPENANQRYKAWLENIQDWSISRTRFFGTPIPVWTSDDQEEMVVVGSIDELVELAGLSERPTDLHREFIDNILIPSKQGKGMLKSSKVVLDCWFDSACVPYGQIHYPFENKELLDNFEYLSDFVCEGSDQIHLWFYVLNVISTALFNKPAFKDVISTGLIYDENGNKYSKKFGNFKDPFELLDKYGADALRLYLINSPLINMNILYFNEVDISTVKQKLIPYINSVKFLITQFTDFQKKGYKFNIQDYKNINNNNNNNNNSTDKWIISKLGSTLKNIKIKMESYQLDKCIQELLNYIEDITNWYIKFNRERLRGLLGEKEWSISLSTLYHVLINFVKIMTPFTPFLSEYIYSHLKYIDSNNEDSVLLCSYPNINDFEFNEQIELQISRMRQVVKLVRKLRDSTTNLKTIRVPIKKIIIYHNDSNYLDNIKAIEDLAQEEMNCESFEYKKFSENIILNIIPNNKSLGSKYKSEANLIKQNLDQIINEDIIKFANNEIDNLKLTIIDDNNIKEFILTKNDVQIEVKPNLVDKKYLSETSFDLMVSIDSTYDENSHNNYQMRLMLREIQKLRRGSGLNPWNKINVHFKTNLLSLTDFIKFNKMHIENKLKCEITIDSLPTSPAKNIFAQTKYEWEMYSKEHIQIIATIILE